VLSQQQYARCVPCLRDLLVAKVKTAVRCRGLQAGDALAVAFSGGASSAALAHLLALFRSTKRADERPETHKTAFSMRLVHVDESAAHGLDAGAAAAAAAAVAAAAAPHCREGVTFHSVPLHSVFDDGDGDDDDDEAAAAAAAAAADALPRARLLRLLDCVGDPTGRDDLVTHLRTRALLAAASSLGCGRLALGHTSTALAVRVVAAAAKGCGYSLPADVQAADARYGAARPVVLYPMREVCAHDAALAVRHFGLATAAPGPVAAAAGADKRNVNALAARFVAAVQAHNRGGVANIMSAATRLQAFPWNEPPAAAQRADGGGGGGGGAATAEGEGRSGSSDLAAGGEVLCPLCFAPLADDELPGQPLDFQGAAGAGLCYSCATQIAGGGGGGGEAGDDVAALLPDDVRRGMAALAAAGGAAAGRAPGRVVPPAELRAAIADSLL
jgi:cytoplasmic tRNA 2-thiolation protein 2